MMCLFPLFFFLISHTLSFRFRSTGVSYLHGFTDYSLWWTVVISNSKQPFRNTKSLKNRNVENAHGHDEIGILRVGHNYVLSARVERVALQHFTRKWFEVYRVVDARVVNRIWKPIRLHFQCFYHCPNAADAVEIRNTMSVVNVKRALPICRVLITFERNKEWKKEWKK